MWLRRFLPLAGLAVALGGAVLLYPVLADPGPVRSFVRGHVGDVAATMLVYALLGMVLRGALARPRWRALGAMAIATAIEVGQRTWTGTGVAGELFVGSAFDGWDFLAYVTGTLIALAYDLRPQKIE